MKRAITVTPLCSIFLSIFFFNAMQSASSQTFELLKEHKRYFAIAEKLQKIYAKKNLKKFIAFSQSSVFIELHLPWEAHAVRDEWVKIRINKTSKKAEVGMFNPAQRVEIEEHLKRLDSTVSEGSDSDWFRRLAHESVQNAIAKADYIAKIGVNCAPGDNYELSFYDKIQVSEAILFLHQENNYNAKSLRGNEYSMRKFAVEIELPNAPKEHGLRMLLPNTKLHKNMRIHFLDSSSERYKECGERIESAIQNLVGRK